MLPIQCRMARAALDLVVRKLAAAAKVSPDTVVRFERGERINQRGFACLRFGHAVKGDTSACPQL